VNRAASPPPPRTKEPPGLVPSDLWPRLPPSTRDKVLRELARIVAEQLLVPPNARKGVGHERP